MSSHRPFSGCWLWALNSENVFIRNHDWIRLLIIVIYFIPHFVETQSSVTEPLLFRILQFNCHGLNVLCSSKLQAWGWRTVLSWTKFAEWRDDDEATWWRYIKMIINWGVGDCAHEDVRERERKIEHARVGLALRGLDFGRRTVLSKDSKWQWMNVQMTCLGLGVISVVPSDLKFSENAI